MSDTTGPGDKRASSGLPGKAGRDIVASWFPQSQRATPAAINYVDSNGGEASESELEGTPASLSDIEMPNQTGEQAKEDEKAAKSPPAPTQQEQNAAAREQQLEDDEQEALIAFGIAAHCTAEAQKMDLKDGNVPKLARNMAKTIEHCPDAGRRLHAYYDQKRARAALAELDQLAYETVPGRRGRSVQTKAVGRLNSTSRDDARQV